MARQPEPTMEARITQALATTPQQRARVRELFTGPSVDLHHRAMQARAGVQAGAESPDGQREFLRWVYATLCAWGMHRMGMTSTTKMPPFDDFEKSVKSAWPEVQALWDVTPPLSEPQWRQAQEVFNTIVCGISGSRLVSTWKVMHHLLPELFAPIDRRYTLAFFREAGRYATHPKDPDYEWGLFRRLHQQFFHVLAERLPPTAADGEPDRFGTSRMKVADNLIIAAVLDAPPARRQASVVPKHPYDRN